MHLIQIDANSLVSSKLAGANKRTFSPQELYSAFSSPHNYSQRVTTPNCSNRAQKASTRSYRNLLFARLRFLTFSSSLKICCYFWSPEVCSSWSTHSSYLSCCIYRLLTDTGAFIPATAFPCMTHYPISLCRPHAER